MFDTFKNQSMKNIRDNNYNDIDRNYENYLLYYACEFLKERKLHEMENDMPTEELLKTLFEKFNLNNGSLELIKALKDFNNMVNDILYNSDTKMIHSEVAEEIRKCSSVNDLISFSKDLTLTDDAQELKIAKGIDKFAEGILEKSYDMIRNL